MRGLLGLVAALLIASALALVIHNDKMRTTPEKPPQSGEIELIAQTEYGTKVYRVTDKKLIVPLILVESSKHVVVR